MITAIWIAARTFFSANGLLIGSVVGLGVLFWTYDASRFGAGVAAGKERERNATETANRDAARFANRVRSRAKSGGMRDTTAVDPYYVD